MPIAPTQIPSPPPPLTTPERLKMFLVMLFSTLAVLALSTIFIDYPKFWRQTKEQATPAVAQDITLDNSTFANYFTIEKSELSPDLKSLRLLLRRSKILPTTTQPATNPITHDSLARGYIRVEFFDANSAFISFTFLRIADLRQSESMELLIPLPANPRAKKINFTN